MDSSTLGLGALAVVLVLIVVVRHPERLPSVRAHMLKQSEAMILRVPLALVAASFLAPLVPARAIGPLIGPESGLRGVFLACVFGGMIPGGPSVTFPLALVIWHMGAGREQMVALLAGWSVYAIHRILSYELPLMGGRFVAIRMTSSMLLPPVAGLLAVLLAAIAARLGLSG